MGFISWIILGLIVGALAKWIMPGKDGGGWIMTILLGIAGAFVGGYIGQMLGWGGVSGFDVGSLALAVLGALVVLFVYNKVSN
ncbi:GlsB/YeaQ/YmgE family stress response membrane protein [Ferrimonas balearica]|uniref:GlsB/YeaQ/YmgE family stress response membrane protein n=1 Tax=Ferrimonas balearica TaxID=44012 RepID=UPI001C58BDB5|nr:GlsB/YeaQ/YmgE family stress response membrane protein [Ferrimonas balearica]MBY6019040.1 GlsB/YeaQ/YmgE family stress response membrane protein [Halomonas denitrificans]MBW3141057.1 GlsB/YeaQ/YmgE family stress response membrane protein [Ferrimonas balearica]MBW3165743.1 GlsB/YeaQ/YmgE family stress response membrane protein [Ferrimonas balearica]MBY5981653.1 GlsB/YeaQ/YmgE family stress response membrane protein [Ferrimonas balearica]MBY6095642.1 GlsB/YeaQ/YmgE family stress response memb